MRRAYGSGSAAARTDHSYESYRRRNDKPPFLQTSNPLATPLKAGGRGGSPEPHGPSSLLASTRDPDGEHSPCSRWKIREEKMAGFLLIRPGLRYEGPKKSNYAPMDCQL